MKLPYRGVFSVVSLCCALAVAHAAPGDLVTTWGTGGKVVVPNANPTIAHVDTRQAIPTSDGGMVLLGLSDVGFAVDAIATKHTSTGAVDPSFGKRMYRFSTTGTDYLIGGTEIVSGPHAGKLLVSGSFSDGGNTRALVARLGANGVIDTTFGTNGFTVIPRYGDHGRMEALGVMSDAAGKVVVVGWSDQGLVSPISGWIARLSDTGVMDGTFGAAGTLSVRAPDGAGFATNTLFWRVAQQASGSYVVAGQAYLATSKNADNALVARVTGSGALDPAFATGGVRIMDLSSRTGCPSTTGANVCGSRFYTLALDTPNNRIVLGGDATASLAPASAYNSTAVDVNTTVGTVAWLDPNGGTTGMPAPIQLALNRADPGGTGAVRALSPDGSGNLFAGIQTFGIASLSRVGVAKLNSSGALVTAFTNGGTPSLPGLASVGISSGDTRGVRVNADGSVIVAGHGRATDAGDGRPRRFHSAKFLASGVLDSTYGGVPPAGLVAGQAVNTSTRVDSQGRVTVVYPDDSTLLVSSKQDALNTDGRNRGSSILLTKLFPNGTVDLSFGTGGSRVVPRLNDNVAPVVGSMTSIFPRTAARNNIVGGPAEGKIVIGGQCTTARTVTSGAVNTSDTDACLVRIDGATGAVDTTFGAAANGYWIGGASGSTEVVYALRMHGATLYTGGPVDPNAGKIVFAIETPGATPGTTTTTVRRLTEAGLPDNTFVTAPAADDHLMLPLPTGATTATVMSPRALRIDRQGKYVVSGFANAGLASGYVPYVARISSGAMDSSFATGGVYAGIPANFLPSGDAYSFGVALYNNGRIVFGGAANLTLENARSRRSFVGALTPTGQIDPTFGVDGWAVIDEAVDTLSSEPFGTLGVEPGGRIVVGTTRSVDDVGKTSEMRVTRLEYDGTVDATYGTAGTRAVVFETAPTQPQADIIRTLNADSTGNLIFIGLTWDNLTDGRVPAAFKLATEAISIDSTYRDFLSFRDGAYQQQHVYTATNRGTTPVALNLALSGGGSSKFTLDNTLCVSAQCAEGIGATTNVLPVGLSACGVSLAAGAQCYFMLSFRPTLAQPGSFRETLTVGDLSATIDGHTCLLDLDRDSGRQLLPAVEGTLYLRYLLGLRGSALIDNIAWPSTPPTSANVEARIARQLLELDLDGDTSTNALRDGLMLVRGMLGLTGNQVTQGAINLTGSRNTWPAVQNHLRRVCGAPISLK